MGAARGHNVTAVTRSTSGIGGKDAPTDVEASFSDDGKVRVVVGDVSDEASLTAVLEGLPKPADSAICCLASRTGGR